MYASTHYDPARITGNAEYTVAHWSTENRGTAIIFIHGFGGDPITSWRSFPDMVVQSGDFSGVDIFFFGYNSKEVRANLSAAKLLHFVRHLSTDLLGVITRSLGTGGGRSKASTYNRIILVAHSLGGALCRQVVLDCQSINESWAGNLELLLFAPAHKGADVMKLARDSLFSFPISRLFAGYLVHRYPILYDLEPGSDFLKNLEEDTKNSISAKHIAPGRPDPLIAKMVVFGDQDNVVCPNTFASDPAPIVYTGKNHTSVCKPNVSFYAPYRALRDTL